MDINLLKSHLTSVHNMSNTTQRNLYEDVEEIDEDILDFFEGYFGNNLTEDASIEILLEAVHQLNETTAAVYEFLMNDDELETDDIAREYILSVGADADTIEESALDLFETCQKVNNYFQSEGFIDEIWGGLGIIAMAKKMWGIGKADTVKDLKARVTKAMNSTGGATNANKPATGAAKVGAGLAATGDTATKVAPVTSVSPQKDAASKSPAGI